MQERLITLERQYEREYSYIKEQLRKEQILFAPHEIGRRLALDVATTGVEQENKLKSIVEEVLFTAFKWEYYARSIKRSEDVEDLAILFCLLDFDSIGERKFFRDKVFDKKELHIDAVYNFGIKEIKSVWLGYVDLVNEFYKTRPERCDKLELIAYMLSLNIKNNSKKQREFYLFEDSKKTALQDLFYYRKKDCTISGADKDVQLLIADLFGKS